MIKKRIMLVDDNKEFLEELNETLTLGGYETAIFSDGQTALKSVYEVKPDLILLDLKMEGKNGFQVADELSRSPETKDIPIIAMTAFYTKDEHRPLMHTCGIRAHVIKPFNPLDIIAKIEGIL
ncbi:MAG: response regulator [Candidatus Omnitrophica bacterium]|nr:response regulator [Candidatus Omnitrophota bacterium]